MSQTVNKKEYRKRVIDEIIERYLGVCSAICIEGLSGVEKLGHLLIIQIVNF